MVHHLQFHSQVFKDIKGKKIMSMLHAFALGLKPASSDHILLGGPQPGPAHPLPTASSRRSAAAIPLPTQAQPEETPQEHSHTAVPFAIEHGTVAHTHMLGTCCGHSAWWMPACQPGGASRGLLGSPVGTGRHHPSSVYLRKALVEFPPMQPNGSEGSHLQPPWGELPDPDTWECSPLALINCCFFP